MLLRQPLWKVVRLALVAAAAIGPLAAPRDARAADEELKRRQATIKGLVVRKLDGGKRAGAAIGIVATAGQRFPGGQVAIRGTIGPSMESALKEAERYVRVEHPDLGNVDIQVSFEERYAPKDGGSAGTAFAVLLRSLTDGYAVDPNVSMTGDIAVNGTVQPIGGVTAKLRGSRQDGGMIVVIPKANVPAVADLLVGPDKVEVLADLQVFSVETVDQAVAVARVDRGEKVATAIKTYADAQAAMKARKAAALSDPAVQRMLRTVLDLAPNHVSAKYALDIATGKGPRTLTRNASLIEVFAVSEPFAAAMNSGEKLTREALPTTTVRQVQRDLQATRRLVHPDVEPLRLAVSDWIDAIDRVLSANRPISKEDAAVIARRRDALRAALKRLESDEALVEKMMREGY